MGADVVMAGAEARAAALPGKPAWPSLRAQEEEQRSGSCGREGAPTRARGAAARAACACAQALTGCVAARNRLGSTSPTHAAFPAAKCAAAASADDDSVGDNIYGALASLGDAILRCAARRAAPGGGPSPGMR
jgi:hypothetical protein